jgi:hypothetical protein
MTQDEEEIERFRNMTGRRKKMKWRRRKRVLQDDEGSSNGLLDIILACA